MFSHDCICDTLGPSNSWSLKQILELSNEVKSDQNKRHLDRQNDDFPNPLFFLASNSISHKLYNNHGDKNDNRNNGNSYENLDHDSSYVQEYAILSLIL